MIALVVEKRALLARFTSKEMTMTKDEMVRLEAALHRAFVTAIQQVGLQTFKSSSFFGSNEQVILKKAA